MKYTCKWADTYKDSYIVSSETGYHLAPLEVESLLNPNRAENTEAPNVIHKDGRFLIWTWKRHTFWSKVQHNGNIMFMDNPELSTIVTLPNSNRVKIIGLGTDNNLKAEQQQPTVFVKPWPEIGVDGFIKD